MFDGRTTCLVVVGAQWGDEGKGKLVDVLAERADLVVRYQGGANAGHTVVIGDTQFILRQIPSGILHAGVVCVVGNGVVLEPETFFGELDQLDERGVSTTGRIFVSDRAHLVLPYHKLLDAASEKSQKLGTTGRGIGPAYEDKYGRRRPAPPRVRPRPAHRPGRPGESPAGDDGRLGAGFVRAARRAAGAAARGRSGAGSEVQYSRSGVMTARARPPSRRTARAPRTARRRRFSRMCRCSAARRPSGVVCCRRL